jgi:hypothetical protein
VPAIDARIQQQIVARSRVPIDPGAPHGPAEGLRAPRIRAVGDLSASIGLDAERTRAADEPVSGIERSQRFAVTQQEGALLVLDPAASQRESD